ncbi:MAG: MOSC domain-containing protein [Pseudomonadales bacterium]|jgi:MOSC domain-containing protein YiiM|nr:MOSC domain-containing protein [Pseudomonadales bacterium]
MEVVSINVGQERALEGRSFKGVTGIFKTPVGAPVAIGPLGLADDAICDTRHHGGPDQALYLYRQEDYDWWSTERGATLAPGTFGDNLTVRGLPEPGLPIGTRLRFSDLLLEVSAPRIPCNTLAQRMDDPGFVKAFVRAERPGIYLRVIEPGTLAPGEAFTLEPYAGDQRSTTALYRDSYRKLDDDEIRAWLALPIDARTRAKLEAKLAG